MNDKILAKLQRMLDKKTQMLNEAIVEHNSIQFDSEEDRKIHYQQYVASAQTMIDSIRNNIRSVEAKQK
jgi:vacuolar-type H+-ATPase subunit H